MQSVAFLLYFFAGFSSFELLDGDFLLLELERPCFSAGSFLTDTSFLALAVLFFTGVCVS